jgi:hypothetical protein
LNANWIAIVSGILAGGAAGAILTALFTNYRNRIQPIGYQSAELKTVSLSLDEDASVLDEVDDSEEVRCIQLVLTNMGNQDMPTFLFGITTKFGDRIVHTQFLPPDRHHMANISDGTELGSSEIDYHLTPFNRGDTYKFNLFLHLRLDDNHDRQITLSSPHPIRFGSNQPEPRCITALV